MNLRLQIVCLIIILLGEFYLFRMVNNKKLELKQALLWMIAGFVIMLFLLIPKMLEWFTHLFGITVSSNMIFLLGFLFVLCILISHTIEISNYQKKIKQLTQELALVKKELMQQDKKVKNERRT